MLYCRPLTFAKEAIAVMAERGVKNALWHRIVASVRRFLRTKVKLERVDETAFDALLRSADRVVVGGNGHAGAE